MGTATAIGTIAHGRVALPDMVALYLLAITVTATKFGRAPSLVAAALSVLAYDFFFIPPLFTLAVADLRHLVTFVVMFTVGLVISGLTLRIRRHELEAVTRAQRTAALYALSRDLSAAATETDIAGTLARGASTTFGTKATVFLADDKGASSPAEGGESVEAQRRIATQLLVPERRAEGPRDADPIYGVPLRAGSVALGAMTFSPPIHARDAGHASFLDTFAQQGAFALQRARLAGEAESAGLRAHTEELRSTLLTAISHDLRTPLAVIMGAATTLREGQGRSSAPMRAELLDTICDEAERIERVVRNLLDMTKLDLGPLQVRREWIPASEVVGSALMQLDRKLAGRPVRTSLSPDLPALAADPVLLQQVFVNLLENAVNYTPAGSPIEIDGQIDGERILLTVSDSGPGLPAGAEERVFERLFRGPGAGGSGTGLGLSICRGIIEAHGGTIVARNRDAGGSAFVISLPRAAALANPVDVGSEVPERSLPSASSGDER